MLYRTWYRWCRCQCSILAMVQKSHSAMAQLQRQPVLRNSSSSSCVMQKTHCLLQSQQSFSSLQACSYRQTWSHSAAILVADKPNGLCSCSIQSSFLCIEKVIRQLCQLISYSAGSVRVKTGCQVPANSHSRGDTTSCPKIPFLHTRRPVHMLRRAQLASRCPKDCTHEISQSCC